MMRNTYFDLSGSYAAVAVSPPNDGCASVDDWRAGRSTAYPATVDIPFAIAGDFVYHCHILEHEDGGMMARIRVRTGR